MSSPRNLSDLTTDFTKEMSKYAKKAVYVVREMESMGYSRTESIEIAKVTAALKLNDILNECKIELTKDAVKDHEDNKSDKPIKATDK